jgi:hypothetical protein
MRTRTRDLPARGLSSAVKVLDKTTRFAEGTSGGRNNYADRRATDASEPEPPTGDPYESGGPWPPADSDSDATNCGIRNAIRGRSVVRLRAAAFGGGLTARRPAAVCARPRPAGPLLGLGRSGIAERRGREGGGGALASRRLALHGHPGLHLLRLVRPTELFAGRERRTAYVRGQMGSTRERDLASKALVSMGRTDALEQEAAATSTSARSGLRAHPLTAAATLPLADSRSSVTNRMGLAHRSGRRRRCAIGARRCSRERDFVASGGDRYLRGPPIAYCEGHSSQNQRRSATSVATKSTGTRRAARAQLKRLPRFRRSRGHQTLTGGSVSLASRARSSYETRGRPSISRAAMR